MGLVRQPWYRTIAIAMGDVLLLLMSYIFAFMIRFRSFYAPHYNWIAYKQVAPWEFATLIIVFSIYGLYNNTASITLAEFRGAIITALMANGLFTLSQVYLLSSIGLPRSVFVISLVMQIPLFLVWRQVLRSYLLRHAPPVTVLVIGHQDEWNHLATHAKQILSSRRIVYAVPDAVLNREIVQDINAIILGSVPATVREQCFLHSMAHNIPCFWTPDAYDMLVSRADLTTVGESPMFSLTSINTRQGSAVFKRLVDISIAALGLVILCPLMLTIGLAIYMEGGRPVLLREKQMTVGGHAFGLVKFRTIPASCSKPTDPVLVQKHPLPITPFGRFLRKTHLDELPQLWNILIGDTSLVGLWSHNPTLLQGPVRTLDYNDLNTIAHIPDPR